MNLNDFENLSCFDEYFLRNNTENRIENTMDSGVTDAGIISS